MCVDKFDPSSRYGHVQYRATCLVCHATGVVPTPGLGILPFFDGITELRESAVVAEDMAACDGDCGRMADIIEHFHGDDDLAGWALYCLRWVPGGVERIFESSRGVG